MKITTPKSIKGLLFVLIIILSSSFSLKSQVLKAFSQRSSIYTPSKKIYNIRGDYSMIGNTNLTLITYDDNSNNSNNYMEYVDVDGDPSTFNSSSATLELSTENGAVPVCSNIIYAGLYWTGRASSSYSPEEFTVTKGSVTKTFNKRKVKFKGPGATSYTDLEANAGDIYYPTNSSGNMYSSYIEITDYVKTHGLGEYTLADMALVEGNGGTTGYYGGWGMIVVYENVVMDWRDITVFDGHAHVQGSTTVSYELPVSGFQTALNGPINMKLGVMAGEGDVGISGDYFQIRNWQNTNWVTLSHAGNSSNNFFNSSIETGGNPRNPALQNNTGLDIASFYIPNTSNSIITNGQTSTSFRYGSTQDTYIIFCIAMAVDAYIPEVAAIVSTEYINGVPVGSGTPTSFPGDLINYKLEVRNNGTEAIDNTIITIPIPFAASFVPSSIVTNINFSPLPTPNNAYYDPNIGPTGSIVWDFGTLPFLPGFPDSVLADISFQLEVTTNCDILKNPSCPPKVVLAGGTTSGVGAISGTPFNMPFIQGYEDAAPCVGQPITSPLIVDIDAAQYVDDNCQSTPEYRDFVFCNYNEATLPVDSIAVRFPPGLGFYSENSITTTTIKYDEDNPFPATVGTKTYFAIPDNTTCYYTFTITTQDSIITNPVLTSQVSCPGLLDGSINLSVNGGELPLSYLWTGPNAFTSPNINLSGLEAGKYNILITDDLGCTAIDSIIVTTIPDVTIPTILCMSNIVVDNDPGVCNYTVVGTTWDAQVSDNCGVASSEFILSGATLSPAPGTTLDGVTFELGVTTVTWEAIDYAGNSNSCSFTVTVKDNEKPVISACPSNIAIFNDATVCGAEVTWTEPTASDNCGVSSFVNSHNSGEVFPVGTTTVTYIATDFANNSATCSFNITVTDNEDPVINNCPVDITIANDLSFCRAAVTWIEPTANDNCGVITFVSSHTNGSNFPVGTTTVTYTATDAANNTATCSFNIIVTDNENPTITCQPTVSVVADLNSCEANASGVNLVTPVTGDNCGVASVTNNAPVSYPVGTTVVTWTVTDIHGNSATCAQNVNVADTVPPVISSCGAVGPQTVNTDSGVCTYTNSGTGWDAVATDNCTTITLAYVMQDETGAPIGTGNTLDGVAFNSGTTYVTWTVTDSSGNFATCGFEVTVIDDQDPVVTNCPSDIIVSNDVDSCGATVAWNPPTFTDNCGTVNVISTHNSGDYFPVGTTTVTYTGEDASGNSAVCSFDVTVNDTQLPLITCNADINSCSSVVTFSTPNTYDNCGVASVTLIAGLPSGSNFPVGVTTVTYEVEDIHGNTAQCSFDVTIVPSPLVQITPTDVSCYGQGDGSISLNVTNGTLPYTYVWSNGSTDKDISGLIPDTYIVVVSDSNGCSTAMAATITEPDSIQVSGVIQDVLCFGETNGEINLTVSGGTAPYTYYWSDSTTTQNLTGVSAGIYSVYIADYNGCGIQWAGEIEEPNEIVGSYQSSPAICEAPNGAVYVGIDGGTSPYSFSWSNGATTESLNGVIAGSYELTVTDYNGCTFILQTEVTSESNLDASISSTDLLCYGRNNGTATIIVNRGNGPYVYDWSNGANTPTVSGLGAGLYTVIVIDNFGCRDTLQTLITEPAKIEINLYSPDLGGGYNVKPYKGENGSITSEVSGGTTPYSFKWSTGDTTQNLTGLPAGTYTLIVTDSNNCLASEMIILTQPMTLEMPQGISPNGDGDNDYFVVRGIDAYESNEIKIFNRWGNIVYQQNNYDNTWSGQSNNGDQLPDGTYFVIFTAGSKDGEVQLKGYVDLRRN